MRRASSRRQADAGVETVAQLRDIDPHQARKCCTLLLRSDGHHAGRGPGGHPLLCCTRGGEAPPAWRGWSHLYVGLEIAEHRIDLPQHSPGTTIRLVEPTNDTLTLCAAAASGLRRIWRDGYSYYRAGVLMDDLVAVERAPRAWVVEHDRERRERLMSALDGLNARFGRRTIFPAGAGIRQGWSTKAGKRSASFTTRLEQLPVAQA